MILRIFNKIKSIYRYIIRKQYFERLRNIYDNDMSIISNNCTGSRISQDLGYKYNSPTVGLYIKYPDFIVFLSHLSDFLNAELTFENSQASYPIGHLKINEHEITIFFLHYKTEDEAKTKWNRRKIRINWDKLFIIGTETDGCSYSDIMRFKDLPFKNKIFFTANDYNISSDIVIPIRLFKKKGFVDGYRCAHHLYKYLSMYKFNY